jgi:hypothetical protein
VPQANSLTPAERSLRARIAAHDSWARTTDRAARTARARSAFENKFLADADGDPRRAESLRRAYYARLALKSAQARRRPPNQTGLFNASNTLTRQYNSTGGDTVIDTILEAATDIREGAAYAQADLILLNPADWLTIRKLKTTFNSYVLDPNDPNTLGGIDNIFGIRVVVSTEVPQGSAAVLDSKIAVNIFRRWGLEIMANPYSDTAFEYNQIAHRAETRFALGVIYPKAICLVDLTDAA